MGRATILSKITTFILTGGRRTTASGTRDVLTEMANSYVSCIYDTAANFTSSNPILETKQHGVETDDLTTSPKFKIGDGITDWNSLPYAGGSNRIIGEQQIISGTTLTLANIPISGKFAGYLNGQRCGIGYIISSIVGDTVTFDDDYTGSLFIADYEF